MKINSILIFIIYFIYVYSDNLFEIKKKREKKRLIPKGFNLTEKLNKVNNSFTKRNSIKNKIKRAILSKTFNISKMILKNKYLKKDEARRRKKFEKLISKFDDDHWINFEINKGNKEIIYEDINDNISFYFAFIINDSKEKIKFTFKEPKTKDEKKGAFYSVTENYFYKKFTTNKNGTYKFIFNNRKNRNLKVSFALKYRMKNSNLTEIDRIGNNMNKISKYLNIMRAKENLINKLTKSQFDAVNKHNKNIVIYGIIEIFAMIIILFVQLFYIKGLVNKF